MNPMLEIKFREGEKEKLLQKPQKKPLRKKRRKLKKKRGPKAISRKKRFKFIETQVGHFLYVYAPLQYCLLMEYYQAMKMVGRHQGISYNIIETIALHSDNPAFRTARFRRALIAYRRFGLKPLRPTGWTLKDACYFARNSFHVYEAIKRCTE